MYLRQIGHVVLQRSYLCGGGGRKPLFKGTADGRVGLHAQRVAVRSRLARHQTQPIADA